MEISISGVTGFRVSEIGEYGLDEDDIEAGEEQFYRMVTIETDGGTLNIEIESVAREVLKLRDNE